MEQKYKDDLSARSNLQSFMIGSESSVQCNQLIVGIRLHEFHIIMDGKKTELILV